MTDPPDLLDIVARRSDMIRTLCENPQERHVLVDHVDASKSTVYKAVSQLTERGLVESTSAGLEPTLLGIVALEHYERFEQVSMMAPLLENLPRKAIPPSALTSAKAVVPDDQHLERHHDRVEELLRTGTRIRGFSPAIAPRYVSIITDRLEAAEISVEFVLPDDLVEFLRREQQVALADVVDTPAATLYRTATPLLFTLLIIHSPSGTTVCIELQEEETTSGLLVNDTPECRQWAERAFERVTEDAVQVAFDDDPEC